MVMVNEQTNWHEAINIAHLHRFYAQGGISLQQVAKGVVRKLKNTEAWHISDPELVDIMCGFEAIDELARLKDYCSVLDSLYEFGDKDNRLWVETEGVSLEESDDIPAKTNNPFEEDTKPQFKPHYHGPNSVTKGPYITRQTGSEWVSLINKESEWDKDKHYYPGDIVTTGTLRYRCKFSCRNVPPGPNSFGQPDHAWVYLGPPDKNPSDPAMVFKDRLTCSAPTKGRTYASTRKYRYMSEEDFNKKLVESNIIPATMPRDLYSYMKDCEEPYQQWLIERWHKQNLTFKEPLSA